MENYTIFEYLLELMQETSRELINIYHKKENRKTLLVFPVKRDGTTRISEQDLRFALTTLHGKFSHPNLSFSVETPTVEEYSFSGKKERSASSDLSFYNLNDKVIKKVINIEVKSRNPEQKSIEKDIEKLGREPVNGAWLHILENEDSGTIKILFKKFITAFGKFPYPKHPISFHILILKTGTLISRKGTDVKKTTYKDIFNIKYSDWKDLKPGKYQFINGEHTTENNPNEDWQIDKFDLQ